MFRICDGSLNVLSERNSLAAAKATAAELKAAYPDRVYFVCDWTGKVVAGY